MPFKSKSQQRFLFAKNPALARRWAKMTAEPAKLPERAPVRNQDERIGKKNADHKNQGN